MSSMPVKCALPDRFPPRPLTHARVSLSLALLVSLAALAGCAGSDTPVAPLDEEQTQRIMAALHDRSFRQFEPSKDASPRQSVILDFFGENGIVLWAQFSRADRAIHEWSVISEDFHLVGDADGSEITARFNESRSEQVLPSKCEDCIDHVGVSISIRNVFDPQKISFRVNDPDHVLPLPFPVFDSWTRFQEDEYFE